MHGVGGVIGAVLTGIFVSPAITGSPLSMPMLNQVWVQLEGILATALYCGVVTWIIAKGLQATIGLRVSDEEEYQGLDLSVHGERLE